MTPSVDQRLASMIRAMAEIILPELAETKGLAKEQAGLVLGHLMVIREQFDHALRYEELELASAQGLGRQLLAAAQADSTVDEAIRSNLAQALAAAPATRQNPAQVRARLDGVNAAIEQLITDCGDGPFIASTSALILAYGKIKSDRDRCFFQGMRFEAADSPLPSIGQMMDDFETEVAATG